MTKEKKLPIKSPLKKTYKKYKEMIAEPERIGVGDLISSGNKLTTFEWDEKKLEVANMIAEGYPNSTIAEKTGINAQNITKWKKHPDFCKCVDDIVLETGIALKNMRIGTLKRLARDMEEAFYIKLADLRRDPSYERLKDISGELRELLKQIATEKEEFVEVQKNIVSGEINVMASKVENFVTEFENEKEREMLKNEFEKVADRVVTQITSGQTSSDEIIDVEGEVVE